MDYAKQIHRLDDAITQVSVYLSYTSSYSDMSKTGEEAKITVIAILNKISASQSAINAIQSVSFGSSQQDFFLERNYNTADVRNESRCNAYRQSINAIINILKQERERLVKEQADEEQKRSKQMVKWTLIFSAIAAICAIISVALAIFNYLCNN